MLIASSEGKCPSCDADILFMYPAAPDGDSMGLVHANPRDLLVLERKVVRREGFLGYEYHTCEEEKDGKEEH